MDKSVEKQIKKFASPSVGYLFVGVVGAAFSGFFAYGYDSLMAYFLFGLCAVFSLGYCTWFYFGRIAALNKKLAAVNASSESLILMNDFQKAGRAFNNTVVVGDKFIIPKDSGYIYSYDEIDRIWQVTESTNGMELRRTINIIDKNGKKVKFFWIARQYYSREEYQSVISFMLSKNPNIKLGEF